MVAIRMRDVSRRFGAHWALRDVQLEVLEGQTVALIGPSGSGKTTLLRLINRLLEPTTGVIEVLGEPVQRADATALRRRIGYVIQDAGLFPHYTVSENVGVVPTLLGWQARRIRERTDELLRLVGLPPEEFGARYPRQLSGGQRQRVGFARALAADPPVILLDEPFGALDALTRETLRDEFKGWARKLGKTFVLVTHDLVEAISVAERVIVLAGGELIQDASPRELVQRASHPVIVGLLGRQRYQLELMTMSLEEALASGAVRTELGEILELPGDTSVWDALDRLTRSNARAVRVTNADGARLLTREQLLESTG